METSYPQVYPLTTSVEKLDHLVESLKLAIEVAPTDRKAHQDLLRKIIQVAEATLQLPASILYDNLISIDEDDPTAGITIVEDDQEFEPEIEILRQLGWKIMTVTQFSQNVEKLADEKIIS